MKVTEEAPGVYRVTHGTATEDAEIIAKAVALLAGRCPDALPDFERGMQMVYRSDAPIPLLQFVGGMLFDFQQATGCDTAEEFLAQRPPGVAIPREGQQ